MRTPSLTVLLILSTLTTIAQKDLPGFGKIDKADLLLQECEYDKDADAYKLLDYGDVRYVRGKNLFKIQTERRVRIKILKDNGLDNANIKIKYYSRSNYQIINDISAITYNLDSAGNVVITKLEKTAIYRKPVTNRISEVAFTLPNVKVGSVIEYKYSDSKESIGSLDDWYFQDDVPTRLSVYKILVPSIFKFVNQVMAYQKVEQLSSNNHPESVTTSQGIVQYNSTEKTYIVRNVPALRDEPFMGAARDYLQRVIFQLSEIDYGHGYVEDVMSTWPKLTTELMQNEDFGLQLKKNIPHTKELDDSLQLVKNDYQRMVLVYDYVRRNMNWNGSESIYTGSGIKSAWDKKSGSNSEMNLILINLLKDAGLTVYPLLVSTKDNGLVNSFYPFLDQFNNAMACVFIGDKRYVLNGADKYNPAWLIPYDVINSEAFIVDERKGGWISLEDDKDIFQNTVYISSEISPEGIMKGEATVTSSGYCKNPRVKRWKEDKASFNDYFSKSFTGMKIENVEVSNENNDTMPLEQKVKFSFPLSSSGEYQYFTVNLFQGLEKNPFLAEERYTDIDYGYNQSFKVVAKIYIPDGFGFEELPKNMKMIMPDTSIVFNRMMQADENSIDLKVTVDFLKPYYSADMYPYFKEFYKKLFASLNEQVVIKKKSTKS
ncbi:MAG: DUF3857 domain-containing protein [Ginsengibacter sp.]